MSAFETLVLNELKKNTVLLDSINSRIDQQEAEILSIKTNLQSLSKNTSRCKSSAQKVPAAISVS